MNEPNLNSPRAVPKWPIRLGHVGELALEEPVTDQKILQAYFARIGMDVHPVATTSFLEKSQAQYPAEWLAREIIQNFVDSNKIAVQSLDGVKFENKTTLSGSQQFSFTAPWEFKDPTALISPHSDKDTSRNTAGGNGIGLKQVAIRLLRDLEAERFEIQGNGWNCEYRLVRAEDVNRNISIANGHQLKNDWLVVQFSSTEARNWNSCIIETKNSSLSKILEGASELGVSKTNPRLQNLNYQSEHGAIKWLLPSDGNSTLTTGSLFINGQIMRCDAGSTNKPVDYWHGPRGVTIQLNNVDYAMSIDRPALSCFDLSRYASKLMQTMTLKDRIRLLKDSEALWPLALSSHSQEPSCETILSELVRKLHFYDRFSQSDFEREFPGRRYVISGKSGRLSEEQLQELKIAGYTVLPSYFEYLGIPGADTVLSPSAELTGRLPTDVSEAQRRNAQNNGMTVTSAAMEADFTPDKLSKFLRSNLLKDVSAVHVKGEPPEEITLDFKADLQEALLWHPLPQPQGNTQKLLYNIRSAAFFLLKSGAASAIHTRHEKYISTYRAAEDKLLQTDALQTRVIPYAGSAGKFSLVIKLNPGESQYRKAIFNALQLGENEVAELQIENVSPKVRPADPTLLTLIPSWAKTPQFFGLLAAALIFTPIGVHLIRSNSNRNKESDRNPNLKEPGLLPKHGLSNEVHAPIKITKLPRAVPFHAGSSLQQILMSNNKASIGSSSQEAGKQVDDTLQHSEIITDFEIVESPTPQQLKRMQLLVTYLEIATDTKIDNNIFVFRGKGAKGINIGTHAIGFHEALLDTSFDEALSTAAHELAHNGTMSHADLFIKMLQAIHSKIENTTRAVTAKLERGEKLSETELYLIEPEKRW